MARYRRPANKGKKCVKRKRINGVLRCVKFGAKRRLRSKKKCAKGVNKITGKCLKHKRRSR